MGAAMLLGPVFGHYPMDKEAGMMAHGSTKLATAVAYKMSALYQENAQHATAAAMEMDNTRRLIERYVLGTDEDANREPLAAPIEENPQRYYDFPYKLGSETWSTNYPMPGFGPAFPRSALNEYGQDRSSTGSWMGSGSGSALEVGPTGWGKAEQNSIMDKLKGMGPMSSVSNSLLPLLRPPQVQRDGSDFLRRSASLPSRRNPQLVPLARPHTSTDSAQRCPAATAKGPNKVDIRARRSTGSQFL